MASCCDQVKHKNVDGHVHFAESVEPHNLIQVKQDSDSQVQVHVGFLQTNHKYEIKFDVPNLAGGEEISGCEKVSKGVKLEVANVQPTDSSNSNLHIIIHLSAFKEGLMKSCFSLQNKDKKEFDIIVHARVLGKYSGTPMVKDGIHCMEVIKDDVDSASELT
ncbi:Hypothetical predicted protein [Paramuricea clavata]|uniref:Adipose-secreted signaling protein n=1 Tax=Paramuricea clavata TaxID=317549 RepID=A0A7D9E0E5_PARCT|nr:Hypothetical predicted protein [Paramuricea clavata]